MVRKPASALPPTLAKPFLTMASPPPRAKPSTEALPTPTRLLPLPTVPGVKLSGSMVVRAPWPPLKLGILRPRLLVPLTEDGKRLPTLSLALAPTSLLAALTLWLTGRASTLTTVTKPALVTPPTSTKPLASSTLPLPRKVSVLGLPTPVKLLAASTRPPVKLKGSTATTAPWPPLKLGTLSSRLVPPLTNSRLLL